MHRGLQSSPLTFSAKEVTALGMTDISTGLKEAHFMATGEEGSLTGRTIHGP